MFNHLRIFLNMAVDEKELKENGSQIVAMNQMVFRLVKTGKKINVYYIENLTPQFIGVLD